MQRIPLRIFLVFTEGEAVAALEAVAAFTEMAALNALGDMAVLLDTVALTVVACAFTKDLI